MSQSVQTVDHGWNKINELFRKYATGKTASVGIQGIKASADHDGITNVEIGAIHEFGSPEKNIPERSFIRSTYTEQGKAIEQTMRKLAAQTVFEGKDPTKDIAMAGEEFRTKILSKINSSIPPALSDVTVERHKGETIPLLNTKQMFNAITSEIADPKDKR